MNRPASRIDPAHASYARAFTIAKIPSLTSLDGAAVRAPLLLSPYSDASTSVTYVLYTYYSHGGLVTAHHLDSHSDSTHRCPSRRAPLTALLSPLAQISPRERTDSELLYLSHVSKQTFASPEEKRAAHPQYEALCSSASRHPSLFIITRPTLPPSICVCHLCCATRGLDSSSRAPPLASCFVPRGRARARH